MSQAKLLPCPFCGGPAKSRTNRGGGTYIFCAGDSCRSDPCVEEDDESVAIAAWNHRAPHPAVAALQAVEKLFATPGYYIGTREGADPLAIDVTFALVAQAVRAAKGEGNG